ncbi:MAG: hypothetical protein U0350_40635 [Caldilineaceae bacterium]
MQTFQRKHRRTLFGLAFGLLLTLAGISLFSHGALAQTDVAALTNKVFLPLISIAKLGGTVPN